jgi:hypothetical protein
MTSSPEKKFRVVSAKITPLQYEQLQKAAIVVYESHDILKPTISRAIIFALETQFFGVEADSPESRNIKSYEASNEQKTSTLNLSPTNTSSMPASKPCSQQSYSDRMHENSNARDRKSGDNIDDRAYFQLGLSIDEHRSSDGKGWEISFSSPLDYVSPQQVYFKQHHTLICGITGASGKTTLLESMLYRWPEKRILAILTKKGEKAFFAHTNDYGTIKTISPFFKREMSWVEVESILANVFKLNTKSLRPAIMDVCHDAKSIVDAMNNAAAMITTTGEQRSRFNDEQDGHAGRYTSDSNPFSSTNGAGPKSRPSRNEKYTQVYQCMQLLLDEMKRHGSSDRLELQRGCINIMDLSELDDQMQSMIVGMVAQEIQNHHTKTVLAIPEAWKFVSRHGDSCYSKDAIESLARTGIANENFVCMDCQDMTAIDPRIRRHIGNFIIGKQQEANEIARTLQMVPLPDSSKPTPLDIQTLELGQFYAIMNGKVRKICSIPIWMDFDEVVDYANTQQDKRLLRAQQLQR